MINMLLSHISAYTIHQKMKKIIQKIKKSNCELHHEMINFNYLMDCIRYQTFRIMLGMTDNPPIRIYVNKWEKSVTYKIKQGII